MMDLQGKYVAELRAEFEAATARLREDLQGQLWNYYGALREPASALKERMEQLEDKLQDFTKGGDKFSYKVQAENDLRLLEVERQIATVEHRHQEAEATIKECRQDLSALKHRMAKLETAQSGATRQLKETQGAQADLQEKLEKLHAKVEHCEVNFQEQVEKEERVQKVLEARLEEQATSLKKEVASWSSGFKELQDCIVAVDAQLKVAGHEVQQLADDQKRALEDMKRQFAQEEATRASAQVATDQKISTLTTQTEETAKTLKGDFEELLSLVTKCQKEETKTADQVERLGERLKEESNATKERFETHERKVAEHMEELKMQLTNAKQQSEKLTQDMMQVNGELTKCQKEEATATDNLEELSKRLKEEVGSTKERFETEQKKRAEQVEESKRQMQLQFDSQLQQMQRDLKFLLHEQDNNLQERVQKQMTEQHETTLQRMQTLIGSRVERCQADMTRMTENRADQTDRELHSLKELQASAQSATLKRIADLQKEVFAALQKNASDIQLKFDHGPSFQKGHEKITEDQLCADLKAVKEGIDAIKNSVNGHAVSVAGAWPVMHSAAPGVMTPPSPAVPLWPTRSQPCSPVAGVRTTGPLLRPSTQCAGSSAVRSSSVSPGWVRPQMVSVKAPPPIAWGSPEPVASASHVPPALLPARAVQVTSQQSLGTSSDASSAESGHPPALLTVSCPATPGLPGIAGEYHLVPGVCPNGQPVWKHKHAELWLYFGTNHRWFVGGPDAKEWKFKCEAGFIYSDPVHAGSTPDQASGWARFQGGIFVADPSVGVSQ